MGDWINNDRRYVPREIGTVLDTGYGDCKDFSALTVAMLRNLGFIAKFALVSRGVHANEYVDILPSFVGFNHTIVYAESPTGIVYWIDPTNRVSMAGKVFPDIANRHALVLDTHQSNYIKIPSIDPKKSLKIWKSSYHLAATHIHRTDNIGLKDQQAIPYTGIGLYYHKDIIEDYIYDDYAETFIPKERRIKSQLPDLNSRIVMDIDMKLEYIVPFYGTSNLGQAIRLDSYSLNCPNDSVHKIYLGSPHTYIKKYIFNRNIPNAHVFDTRISTPWINFTRSHKFSSGRTVILDKYMVKKSYIMAKECLSEEYKSLMKLNEINNAILIIPKTNDDFFYTQISHLVFPFIPIFVALNSLF